MLQRYRAASGLSQEELADRAGLSERGISDLERGKRRAPHPATVRRLAAALELGEPARSGLLAAARAPNGGTGATKAMVDHEVPRHNLPLELTSFIGRLQETADIRRELAKTRLLTLAGPGGVGKTRLALHVAKQELKTYKDGVWYVELAPLSDGELVQQSVANLFTVRGNPQEPLISTLTRRLQPLQLLLILDNCEQVLTACVDLVHRLLSACPHIAVLTTSRQVFGLAGETVWRVPPLQVASPDCAASLEWAGNSEAAALFLERAQATQPGFAVTPRNVAALLEVCRRLDGIPLAIELAASRVSVLGLEQIAERLGSHYGLLSSNDPTIESRQQTLGKTIQWSYDLLTPEEQSLFDRLSVFAGGWSLEAMEAVAESDAADRDDLLALLARLVDKSLVLATTRPDGPPRYRLLEPVRQFGQDRLSERGEAPPTRERHATFFLHQWERGWDTFIKRGITTRWLAPDLDNLRLALHLLIEQRDVDRAQRLAAASGLTWFALGYPAEARRWLEETLALQPVEAPRAESSATDRNANYGAPRFDPNVAKTDAGRLSVRAQLLWMTGLVAVHQGELEAAEQAASSSLELYRQLEDPGGAAWPLLYLGRVAQLRAEFAKARGFLDETLTAFWESRRAGSVAFDEFSSPVQSYLAQVAREEGDAVEAQTRAEEALKVAAALEMPVYFCLASTILGEMHYQRGDMDTARSVWLEGLTRAREQNQRHYYMIPVLIDLGRLAREQGDVGAARTWLAEALTLADLLSRWELAHALEAIVELATADREPEAALQLSGAAAALRNALGTPLWPTESARLATALVHARHDLTTAAADAAWRRGLTTPVDQALALALQVLQHPAPGPRLRRNSWSPSVSRPSSS